MRDVLIIDDDDEARRIFAHVGVVAGYHVRTAADGVEGLAAARAARPDVIILDCRMPLVDGLTFLRDFRSDARGDGVAVAVVTGDYLISDTLLGAFTSLGAVVRFKPLWSEDFIALLRELECPGGAQPAIPALIPGSEGRDTDA